MRRPTLRQRLRYRFDTFMARGGSSIFLSLVIVFVTTALDQKLMELRKGTSQVIEAGHTLILGWNERVVEILRELVLANESERDACVVILAERDKEEMDDFLALHVPDRRTTRIVTRSGPPASLVIPEKTACFELAPRDCLIVLAEDDT